MEGKLEVTCIGAKINVHQSYLHRDEQRGDMEKEIKKSKVEKALTLMPQQKYGNMGR